MNTPAQEQERYVNQLIRRAKVAEAKLANEQSEHQLTIDQVDAAASGRISFGSRPVVDKVCALYKAAEATRG